MAVINNMQAVSAAALYPSDKVYSDCVQRLVDFVNEKVGMGGDKYVLFGSREDDRRLTYYLMNDFHGTGEYWQHVGAQEQASSDELAEWVKKILVSLFNNHGYVYSSKLPAFLNEHHPFVMGLTEQLPLRSETFEFVVGPWSVLEGIVIEKELGNVDTKGLPDLFSLSCSSSPSFSPSSFSSLPRSSSFSPSFSSPLSSPSPSSPLSWINSQLDTINKWLLNKNYSRIIQVYSDIHDSMIIHDLVEKVPPPLYYNSWIAFRVVERVLKNSERLDLIPRAEDIIFNGADCDDELYRVTSRVLTLYLITGKEEHKLVPLPGLLNGLLPGPSLYLEKVFSVIRNVGRDNGIDVRAMIEEKGYELLTILYPAVVNWWGDGVWRTIYYQLVYRKMFNTK